MSYAERSAWMLQDLVEAFNGVREVLDPNSYLPLSLAQAFELQGSAIGQLKSEIGAWKLGASTRSSRTALSLDRIFVGPIPCSRIFESSAEISFEKWKSSPVEAEIAVKLDIRSWLESETADPYEFVTTVHASFELPRSRFPRIGIAGTSGLIADFGAAGGAVIGPGKNPEILKNLDTAPLKCQITAGGTTTDCADSSELLLPPLELLASAKYCFEPFVSQTTDAQLVLLGGLVSTQPSGSCDVVADFGRLGTISISFI